MKNFVHLLWRIYWKCAFGIILLQQQLSARMTISALELAECSDWAQLAALIQEDPSKAQEIDDFGMMPLHWTCTDRDTPLHITQLLIDAYPDALCIKNKGGLIPLHIAVKANGHFENMKLLVTFDELTVCQETSAGETPAELASLSNSTTQVLNYLVKTENELRSLGKASPRQSKFNFDAIEAGNTTFNRILSHSDLFSGQLPPCWKLEKRCKICLLKFSYFKSRHHCRNCGESVCNTHSNRRIPLQHIGLLSPQRVCILCYDNLRINEQPSAVVNIFANRNMDGPNSFRELVDNETEVMATFDEPYSNSRPRSQTSNTAHTYGDMKQQVKELESHVKELIESKEKIQHAVEESNRKIRDAIELRRLYEGKAAEMQNESEIDINRVLDIDDLEEKILALEASRKH
uniref:Uncharacterized protein AlNc14C54G4185 n=1 Tax=Albugo laibachii Nc14 TaxID=890382 RepID=F0WBZ8_9STRA|nr:conserved hypothetical protein [Albugo laibachii Nc14]|eukprot:CCA18679.1 conserved hypothetical protein [Albugo laibachii Nc14]